MLAEEQPLTVKRVSYDSNHHWEAQGQGGAILDHCEERDSQQILIPPSPYELYEKSSKLCVARHLQKRSSFLARDVNL